MTDPGFEINWFWLALQGVAFIVFIVIVVWIARLVMRSRRR